MSQNKELHLCNIFIFTFGSGFRALILCSWRSFIASFMSSTYIKIWCKGMLQSQTTGNFSVWEAHSKSFDKKLKTNICLTSIQMWWIPPSFFLFRKPAIGLLSPKGCKSWWKTTYEQIIHLLSFSQKILYPHHW